MAKEIRKTVVYVNVGACSKERAKTKAEEVKSFMIKQDSKLKGRIIAIPVTVGETRVESVIF